MAWIATAASMALPPAARISSPASTAYGLAAATPAVVLAALGVGAGAGAGGTCTPIFAQAGSDAATARNRLAAAIGTRRCMGGRLRRKGCVSALWLTRPPRPMPARFPGRRLRRRVERLALDGRIDGVQHGHRHRGRRTQ